ncbi:serine/threonine-protein kinase [Streptomyces sp. NBC_00588]|uniref:serine/threonine-protein kinase n=1 Tax=Streptomyces sp. NBC_00588 TaxID=2975784 RepID=UPI002E80A69C|nr:serine/threonine-protein kinase [Streptomyces sp. NBC_00588]WUB37807.1 serine/threonine protein kinase [Streptomyces sp. NBC_00588]
MSEGGERARDGRLVGGRYRLTGRIGSGGMGTVWQAYDELVQRDVAVKQPRLPGDPEDEHHQRAAHRLYREARAAARVDHPAAVSIHDVVEEDGLPWIVMELIRGESLHEVLQRGPVDAVEAARIGLAVLGALRAAHSVGIVHRDVKPANVLLGAHGRVVLTDFGIAHVQGEESLTMSGEFVGSLEFVAPERMSGRGAGPASDLWSLGVLLYAAVEGASPFRRTTLESTLAAVIASDPPEPEQAGPLGPLITRLLVKDPEQRPGAEEAAAVLEAVAEGWPVPSVEAGAARAQDTTGLREFADDVGTVRLMPKPEAGAETSGGAEPDADGVGDDAADTDTDTDTGTHADTDDARPIPEPEARPTATATAIVTTPDPSPEPPTTSVPHPAPEDPGRSPLRRPLPRRPVLFTALGALVVGASWLGASYATGPGDDDATQHTATLTEAPARAETPTPGADAWTAHREKAMRAVLYLPSRYRVSARQGGTDDPPRLVEYDEIESDVYVRLTEWDKAPRSPMAEAQEAHAIWDGYNSDARTQYTRTTFHGHEAVLADTAFGLDDSPTRVMQLMIRTDDGRLYELRVNMPKGAPDEKKGTALFKGARDRLVIEKA